MVPSTFRCALQEWARLICAVTAAMVAPTAAADPGSRTTRPDALDFKATVPPVTYASSLKPEHRPGSGGPVSWREANDTVTRIGGWRVYAREASQPAPATPAVPPVPTATPHAHGGQHKP